MNMHRIFTTLAALAAVAYCHGTFGADRYVATTGSDSNDGLTAATAYATLTKAIEALGSEGGTVYVAAGTYLSTAGVTTSTKGPSAYELTAPIEVIGTGSGPADTIFRRSSGAFRMFFLNHASAKLKNITIDNGQSGTAGTGDDATCGGNVFIYTDGGTVENCIISNGRASNWNSGGGNVYLAAGRVMCCQITGGSSDNNRNPPKETSDYQFGAAVMATGGVVENCLITGNGVIMGGGGINRGSCVINLRTNAKLLNCTVAGNFGVSCAGVYVRHNTVQVKNCAIFNNTATSDDTGHSADWLVKQSGYESAFVGCACASYINDQCVRSETAGFVNPAGGNYRLTSDSCCRDSAVSYSTSGATSTTDLDGKDRKMGTSEDIGCFEFDPSVLSCNFTADITEGLIPCTVTFTGSYFGDGVSSVTYEWDFDGDGVYDTAPQTANTAQRVYENVGKVSVGLRVKSVSQTAAIEKTDYLHLGAPRIYVSTTSTGGTSPYDTPAKAANSLKTAYGVAANGSVIHLAPGEYTQNKNSKVEMITHGVTIVGDDGDPANTVLRSTGSPTDYADNSVICLSHADAKVFNLTLKDGTACNVQSIGCSATILTGGTISNCVITGGKALKSVNMLSPGVYMKAGLLTHSIIENCAYTMSSEATGYSDEPNSRRAQGVYAEGAARIENCLFRNLKSDGLVVAIAGADTVMRNCSIVDCEVSFWTDNPASSGSPSATNPRKQWPAFAVECVGDKGKIYNTVICNVKRRSYTNLISGETFPEVACAAFSRNSQKTGSESDDYDNDSRHCTACASDGTKAINSTCPLFTTADFVDYAGGDLTPKLGGRLHDAGYTISGWTTLGDLAGNPRVKGKRIDVGCYEQQSGGIVDDKIYVDCNYDGSMGASDGSMTCPWKTIKDGCDAATAANMKVFVRGGSDRVYQLDDCSDAGVLTADLVSLIGCDADWTPAVGYADAGKMAVVAVADDYAAQSYTVSGSSTTWNAPFVVNAVGCRISGFRFAFGKDSFRLDKKGGTGLVSVTSSGLTVENCWFKLKDNATDGAAGGTGIVCGDHNDTTHTGNAANCTIRNCYLGCFGANWRCLYYNLVDGARTECCLLENVGTLFAGETRTQNCNYYVISNIFLNCAGAGDRRLLSHAQNYTPAGGEIAYNRAIRNGGPDGRYVFVQHGKQYGGNWYSETMYIHHNTIVGYDLAFEKAYYGDTAANESTRPQNDRYCWNPKIFDNLLVNVKTNIYECSVGLFANDNTSSFKANSTFYNNALYNTVFNGGPAAAFDWYDLKDLQGTNTTVRVDSDPIFTNTENPASENYYRLKVPTSPWVLNAWTGPDPTAPEFPRYIGAVEPQAGGFAVRIR